MAPHPLIRTPEKRFPELPPSLAAPKARAKHVIVTQARDRDQVHWWRHGRLACLRS